MEFVLDGNDKCLRVQGGTVKIIKKAGLFSAQREKVLPIRNISSVEVKEPGFFVGFIQFSIAGGKARDSSYTLTGGSFDAVTDENSVVFNGKQNYQLAIQIRDYIQQYSQNSGAGADQSCSAADEIRKLKSLLDDGILTNDEFESKKKKLLAI